MTTFKQFIAESATEKLIHAMAAKLLGTTDIQQLHGENKDFDKLTSGAKHVGHKFIDTVNGPWTATHFDNGKRSFVKVEPPKGSTKTVLYFTPKGQ